MSAAADLSLAGDDIFVGGELLEVHGAAGVQLIGADTDLGAVGEACGGIDIDRR